MIFVPKKIKVGYRNRDGTYTGRLAYVIYYDERGKLRKETSWQSWRSDKIDPDDFDNEPTQGFVLNKKAGGVAWSSSWNPRQTYCRVYDPRGFEFEITIPNLLWVLENSDCLRGKGLDGEFVYGWDGAELLLVPTASPDYDKISKASNNRYTGTWLKGKDLRLGAIYLSNMDERLIYLGRFTYYEYISWKNTCDQKKKRYFFTKEASPTLDLVAMPSLTRRVLKEVDDPVDHYADLMDRLEHRPEYSPIAGAEPGTPYDFKKGYYYQKLYVRRKRDGAFNSIVQVHSPSYRRSSCSFTFDDMPLKYETLEQAKEKFEFFNPIYILENGKQLRRDL